MGVVFQKTDLASPPDATVVATEQIAGAELQRMKVALGASGVDDGDLSSSNPMPVSGPLTDTELRASSVPVNIDPMVDIDSTLTYTGDKLTGIVSTGFGKTKTVVLGWTGDQLTSIATTIV